ncbi:MAG TPA: hypothetical protein VF960_10850 [Chloroflexota bacterium]
MSDSAKRALQRALRYIFVPALVGALSAILQVIQTGSFNVDWNVVALFAASAAIGGFFKYLRDELGIDVKVV